MEKNNEEIAIEENVWNSEEGTSKSKNKGGRPRKDSGDTIIVGDDRGNYLIWSAGHLSGNNKEILKKAKQASDYGIPETLVPWSRQTAVASLSEDTPLGIIAAMLMGSRGQMHIQKAPQYILDMLPKHEEGVVF